MVGLFRQRGLNDCGLCCLASIGQHYHFNWNVLQLKLISGYQGRALSLKKIRKLALRLNFDAVSVKASIQHLSQISSPFIALIKKDADNFHFVVVQQAFTNKVQFMDPRLGKLIIERMDS